MKRLALVAVALGLYVTAPVAWTGDAWVDFAPGGAGFIALDGSFVNESHATAGESLAGDQATMDSYASVTAGDALLWWGETNDDSPTHTLTFGNGDTTGTPENAQSLLATAFKLTGWPVQNTNGGTITGTYDGSENDGDRWNVTMMMGFDGISTTDMVEDSDSSIVSGAGPHTIDNVTCAGACFVAACIATNRTPTITSGEDVRIAAWTPTGADGFTYVCVTERLSGAGSADVTVSLDVSGFVWGNIWAMNEAAAGGGVPPGIFNNPRRGGGVDLLVRLLEGRYRFPFGPRLVSNKVWVRR